MTLSQEESVQGLMALGLGIDEERAHYVLNQYKWNLDAAASSLLGDNEPPATRDIPVDVIPGLPGSDPWDNANFTSSRGVLNSSPDFESLRTPGKAAGVIDLANDDDEENLRKAMSLSMQSSDVPPLYQEEHDKHWALVPVVKSPFDDPPPTNHDDALNRALEASLAATYADDVYDELSPNEQIRHPDKPAALRTSIHGQQYAALLFQALDAIPQVRETYLKYEPLVLTSPPGSDPEFEASEEYRIGSDLTEIQGIFAHMDMTQRTYLCIDESLHKFLSPTVKPYQSPLEPSSKLFKQVAQTTENLHNSQISQEPNTMSAPRELFTWRTRTVDQVRRSMSGRRSLVKDIVPTNTRNDLVTCLSHLLWEENFSDEALGEAPEVLAFFISRTDTSFESSTSKAAKEPFRFPAQLYLDRWLSENLQEVSDIRDQGRVMKDRLFVAKRSKESLIKYQDKDTLAHLRTTLHYFENVSLAASDPSRATEHAATITKLKSIIATIETALQSVDAETLETQSRLESLFDGPDMQKHPYGLRAVLQHDGLAGRSHVYAYIKHASGTWWKSVDHTVTQVAEEVVFSDPTGLHLNAGPYMLFYSRSNWEPPAKPIYWPKVHRVEVKESNESFRTLLPKELSQEMVDFPSPPLTPVHMGEASPARSEGHRSDVDMLEKSQTEA